MKTCLFQVVHILPTSNSICFAPLIFLTLPLQSSRTKNLPPDPQRAEDRCDERRSVSEKNKPRNAKNYLVPAHRD
ncbi:hypothetical protein F4805DRAFT_93198 [Annulohypoxylon moriforme]|nr:hypothetical protein F4805DRAFT_93198 [Annulohypoxylon moriforme]